MPVELTATEALGLWHRVERVRDERDRRNVVIKRTVAGALYLEKLGDLIMLEGRGRPP
jgi:DNA-binding MarR family transcriptional regulator